MHFTSTHSTLRVVDPPGSVFRPPFADFRADEIRETDWSEFNGLVGKAVSSYDMPASSRRAAAG